MPATHIWAVSNYGKVFTLSTEKQYWEPVNNDCQYVRELKRVSAVKQCVWGIGCDHQIYLYVKSSDVPIRCQEVTYENERWNPFSGFSGKKLLPSDRFHWSSKDGTVHLPKEDFKLPSENWNWEEDWYVDENIEGQITDKGGWQYAVDFPARYFPEKQWSSCVRRRSWVRYRRYISTDMWAKIPCLHADPLEEPFIDVAVGGQDLPNLPHGHLCVWTVSIHGKIYFRSGVTHDKPEGSRWEAVPTEAGGEVTGISVGPTGRVWAVKWDGGCYVRMGITWENVMGTTWIEVLPPDGSKLFQISVGYNAVWAVSREGKAGVWFRKSVCGSDDLETSVLGTSWVAMVGEMMMVSMGPNDQVWGIGFDNHELYFRTGITSAEPSGKTWKLMRLPVWSKFRSSGSLSSFMSVESAMTVSSSESPSESSGNGNALQLNKTDEGITDEKNDCDPAKISTDHTDDSANLEKTVTVETLEDVILETKPDSTGKLETQRLLSQELKIEIDCEQNNTGVSDSIRDTGGAEIGYSPGDAERKQDTMELIQEKMKEEARKTMEHKDATWSLNSADECNIETTGEEMKSSSPLSSLSSTNSDTIIDFVGEVESPTPQKNTEEKTEKLNLDIKDSTDAIQHLNDTEKVRTQFQRDFDGEVLMSVRFTNDNDHENSDPEKK